MFSDILLTVDYDRTLTATDSTIPQRNIEAIGYFVEHGGAFTVNTGRSLPMSKVFWDRVPINAPLVLYNGSAAYDLQTGELSFSHEIDLDAMQTIQACMARFPDMNVEIQGLDAHYCFQCNGDWEGFCKAQPCAFAYATAETDCGPFLKFSLYGEIREPTVSHMYAGTPEEFARMDEAERWLRETFGDKCEVFRASGRILDIHAKGVSKIRAARELQAKLGRKILVCVGDAQNDLPMLEGADHAFVPSDAALANCFETVCPCGEGAVADVIYKKIPEILGLHP